MNLADHFPAVYKVVYERQVGISGVVIHGKHTKLRYGDYGARFLITPFPLTHAGKRTLVVRVLPSTPPPFSFGPLHCATLFQSLPIKPHFLLLLNYYRVNQFVYAWSKELT